MVKAKDKDGNVVDFMTLAKDHLGTSEPSASDIAKEIRARVDDLNELSMLAARRNVVVAYEVIEADDEDGSDYETISVKVSQPL